MGFNGTYPLVNIQKTMENHHFQWVNPLFLWTIFNSKLLNYQMVYIVSVVVGLPNVCTKHKIPKNLQKGQEGSIRPCGSENWVWYSKYILIIAPIAPLYGDGSKPCTPSEPQNSWDLWMFIPLKMVSIGIDPYHPIPISKLSNDSVPFCPANYPSR